MCQRHALFVLMCVFFWTVATSRESMSAQPEPFDLVIRNGRIVDGSGNPWFHADLAIRGDKIAALGKLPDAKARREIDARGLVVAPGFIDMHSHSDFTLLEDGLAQSKIRQGVTTEVLGEGSSPGPYREKLAPPQHLVNGKPTRWTTLGDYFDVVERAGVSTNVASFVGLGTVWECVMGKSHARPTREQLERMKVLVEEAMQNGAAGLSSMLAMPPGSLATTDDIVELCKVVARFGGTYMTHIRNEGTIVFEAIREAIEIGRRAGVAVEILHIKIADQKYWGKMSDIVKLVDDARREGVNVHANIYPYTRGHNNLSSIIPPWAHEGGTAKMLARLKDGGDRAKLKKDIRGGIPGWYNHFTAVGGDWSRMLVSANTGYKGLTVDRILAARKKNPTRERGSDDLDELFDLLIEEGGSIPTVYDHHTEKDMNLALSQPWCSIGSDGLALATEGPLKRGHPHPRSFGTFPRVLGVYVRQRNLLTLEDAVRRMTSLNATKLGLHERGLLRPGFYADVTLFDPERVIDKATYEEPFQYSVGIEYVLVNGEIVLEKGKHTGAKPGRALRRALAVSAVQTPAPAQVELKKGDRILFFGDSLTQLAGTEQPKEHVKKGYVRIVREKLQEMHKDKNIELDWVATSGHTVPDLLKRVDKDVIAKKPTIVFIQIGCNDARRIPKDTFQTGLEELIGRLQKAEIQVIQCSLTSVGEKHDGTNPGDAKMEEFAEVARQVAKKKNVPLNDLRKAFVAHWKANNPDNKDRGILTYDGNHFNDAGHRFVAEQMLKMLR
ncbi:MAG: amidohydrolase family protein [Gemmataceae bacterium]|nr:amidohydrolase family protein [Gemmataceae bacterium]